MRSLSIAMATALSLLVLAGCVEDVVLVEETDRAFTLYGVLNPQRDTQFVHVFPIEGELEPPPAQPPLYVPLWVLEREGVALLITLKLIVASEEWDPPGGTFDPEAMAHPIVMTNVGNGFGFVGAGYWLQHQWRPKMEALEAASFVPPQ